MKKKVDHSLSYTRYRIFNDENTHPKVLSRRLYRRGVITIYRVSTSSSSSSSSSLSRERYTGITFRIRTSITIESR